jgi:hypothetical protein
MVGPSNIDHRAQQCFGGEDNFAQAPSREGRTTFGACPAARPHTIRSAKSAWNAGVARGYGSLINGELATQTDSPRGRE